MSRINLLSLAFGGLLVVGCGGAAAGGPCAEPCGTGSGGDPRISANGERMDDDTGQNEDPPAPDPIPNAPPVNDRGDKGHGDSGQVPGDKPNAPTGPDPTPTPSPNTPSK